MILKETAGSPYIKLSSEECIFEIKGNSYSENINEIYDKVLKWIEENIPEIECPIEFEFNLSVLNSVTYKSILIIMTKFSEYIKNGKKITVIWNYDSVDEDSYSIGEDIKDLFNIPVVFKEV